MNRDEAIKDLIRRCQEGCSGPNALTDSQALLEEAHKALNDLLFSRQRNEIRLFMLQSEQRWMREPERTIVCDILANGQLLPDEKGKRYGTARLEA